MTTATRARPVPIPVKPLTPREERWLAARMEQLGFTVEEMPVACKRALLELDRWMPDLEQQRGALGGRS